MIIDELFMVSAGLLADLDIAFRKRKPKTDRWAWQHGHQRSFGGVNLLGVGDMYQIDPPDGLPLYTIPNTLVDIASGKGPSPSTSHGL